MRNIVLFAASQAAWFVLVLGGARGFAWPGIMAAVACAALAVALADDRRATAALLAVAGLVGGAADYLVSLTGIYEFAEAGVAPAMRPVWFAALWVAFAALVGGPLAWLRGRPALASAFGAIGGPLAYRAGAALAVIRFREPAWRGYLALALLWAAAMPLLLLLDRRLRAWGRPSAPACPRSRPVP